MLCRSGMNLFSVFTRGLWRVYELYVCIYATQFVYFVQCNLNSYLFVQQLVFVYICKVNYFVM